MIFYTVIPNLRQSNENKVIDANNTLSHVLTAPYTQVLILIN